VAKAFLDDFTIGETFETQPYTIAAAESFAFAHAYDPQPFHLDARAAERGIFGELTCSGWHTAAVTMRLVVESGVMRETGIIGTGIDELRWHAPVKPGDSLRVRGEIVEKFRSQRRPERGTLRVRLETLNQHGVTVMSQIANLVVPAQPG
jgi:acyl dehydratase